MATEKAKSPTSSKSKAGLQKNAQQSKRLILGGKTYTVDADDLSVISLAKEGSDPTTAQGAKCGDNMKAEKAKCDTRYVKLSLKPLLI